MMHHPLHHFHHWRNWNYLQEYHRRQYFPKSTRLVRILLDWDWTIRR
jgi:hypothetical protein